jgi:hypothetical protein
VTIEEEDVKDKSKSLEYVIKEKFEAMKIDNQDFSTMSK